MVITQYMCVKMKSAKKINLFLGIFLIKSHTIMESKNPLPADHGLLLDSRYRKHDGKIENGSLLIDN